MNVTDIGMSTEMYKLLAFISYQQGAAMLVYIEIGGQNGIIICVNNVNDTTAKVILFNVFISKLVIDSMSDYDILYTTTQQT